jgi:D-xylonolactonase
MIDYERISDFSCQLGECPIWDEKNIQLWWTDILGAAVHTYSPGSGTIQGRIRGKNVGGFALTGDRSVICACLDGLHRWTPGAGFTCIATSFEGRALRFNDCTTDARGRFLAGTRYVAETEGGEYDLGSLYRVDSDGSISVLEQDIHLSNGLGFSPDDRLLYYTDSLQRVIYRYDYDLQSGSVSNRRVFVKVPDDEGIPDGLTVDEDGYVWSARWDDTHLYRYDPDGIIERKLPSPERKTTSLMFGGRELNELYLTTASERGTAVRRNLPAAGTGGFLYRLRLDIRGRLEHRADIGGKERA